MTINAAATLTVGATGTGTVTIGSATAMGNGNISTTSLIVNGTLVSGNINQRPGNRTMGSGGDGKTNLTINSTGTVTVTGDVTGTSLNGTGTGTASASVVFTGTGTLNVTGIFTTSVFTPSTGIVNYNGTTLQTLNSAYTTYGTLKVNNSVGVTLTAATSVTNLTLGDIKTGSIFNDGGFQLTSNGVFNLNSGTFNIGSGAIATSYPPFTTNNIAAGTTVNYASTAAQTIVAVNYGNLTNTGNGPRTLASSGTIGIKNSFTPSTVANTITGSTIDFNGSTAQTIPAFNYNNLKVSNTNANITLAASGTIGVAGTFTPNTGTAFGAYANSTVSFNGTSAQTIPQFTFNNLTINNTAGVSSIGGDVTVNQSLALTNGIVTTGASKIIVGPTGSSSRTNGWVNGNLQKYFSSTNNTNTFEVGGSTPGTYRPVGISFSTAGLTAGNLTVSQLNGPHPQIANAGISPVINPYWNVTSGGVAGTYSATFTFLGTDASSAGIGNPASMVANQYSSSVWTTTTPGANSATTNQSTGLTTFGDFVIGITTGIPQVTT
ncbi:MAG: hypothetical protein EOO13_11705, partial [Chitinophagaceae bacterium]